MGTSKVIALTISRLSFPRQEASVYSAFEIYAPPADAPASVIRHDLSAASSQPQTAATKVVVIGIFQLRTVSLGLGAKRRNHF